MIGQEPDAVSADRARKLRAKRFNEGLKLAASLFNACSIATIGIAVISPIAQRNYALLNDAGWALIAAAVILHLIAQALLRFLRSED